MPARPNGLGVWVRQGVQDEVLQGRELEVQQRDRREGARVQMSSDQPAGQEAVLVLLQDVGDDLAADSDQLLSLVLLNLSGGSVVEPLTTWNRRTLHF